MSATSIVEVTSAAIVGVGIVLAVSRSISRSIWLVALQSVLASGAALGVGLALGLDHLVAAGVIIGATKGLVFPLALRAMLRASSVTVERHPFVGPRLSLVAAIAIVFAASATTADLALPASLGGARALPAAIATMLTGLFLTISRRKVASLLLGLLVFENGVWLAAFALTYGMPLVVELGILLDLLVAVVVGWVYARRMLHVFGTLSTDPLRSLRG